VLLALYGTALEELPFGGEGNIPEKNSMHGTGGWTSYCIILERPWFFLEGLFCWVGSLTETRDGGMGGTGIHVHCCFNIQ